MLQDKSQDLDHLPVTAGLSEQMLLQPLEGFGQFGEGRAVAQGSRLALDDRQIPGAAKPDHIREILDRLRFVREIGIPAKAGATIHPDRYRQFVREGRASPAYLIERYTGSRRRATLVALLIDLEERLTDAAIEMADKLIGTMFARAKNTQARRTVSSMTLRGERPVANNAEGGIAGSRPADLECR
jgi:hypothetical protein